MSGRLVVKRDLYTKERSGGTPVRAGVAGVGLLGVAYGGSRNQIFQSAIGTAQRAQRTQVVRVADLVERGRGNVERASGAAVRGIGRTPGVGHKLRMIPAKYRAPVALVAGVTAVRGARPIVRDEYKPYTVQGW